MEKVGKDGRVYRKGPDGIWEEVPESEQAQAAVSQAKPVDSPSMRDRMLSATDNAAVQSFGDGLTLGASDELGAGQQSGMQSFSNMLNSLGVEADGESFPYIDTRYQQDPDEVGHSALQGNRARRDQLMKESPGVYAGGRMAGNLLTQGLLHAATGGASMTPLGQGLIGGAQGIATSDSDDLRDRLETGALTGGISAFTAGAFQKAPIATSLGVGALGTAQALNPKASPADRVEAGAGALTAFLGAGGLTAAKYANKGVNWVNDRARGLVANDIIGEAQTDAARIGKVWERKGGSEGHYENIAGKDKWKAGVHDDAPPELRAKLGDDVYAGIQKQEDTLRDQLASHGKVLEKGAAPETPGPTPEATVEGQLGNETKSAYNAMGRLKEFGLPLDERAQKGQEQLFPDATQHWNESIGQFEGGKDSVRQRLMEQAYKNQQASLEQASGKSEAARKGSIEELTGAADRRRVQSVPKEDAEALANAMPATAPAYPPDVVAYRHERPAKYDENNKLLPDTFEKPSQVDMLKMENYPPEFYDRQLTPQQQLLARVRPDLFPQGGNREIVQRPGIGTPSFKAEVFDAPKLGHERPGPIGPEAATKARPYIPVAEEMLGGVKTKMSHRTEREPAPWGNVGGLARESDPKSETIAKNKDNFEPFGYTQRPTMDALVDQRVYGRDETSPVKAAVDIAKKSRGSWLELLHVKPETQAYYAEPIAMVMQKAPQFAQKYGAFLNGANSADEVITRITHLLETDPSFRAAFEAERQGARR